MKTKLCRQCSKQLVKPGKFCTKKCENEYLVSVNKAKKEKKKVSVSALSKELDTVFKRFVRRRDAKLYGVCVTCGNPGTYETLQGGHFMSCRHRNTRWDERNCSGQCYGCNCVDHGRQFEHGLALDERWGNGTAQSMLDASRVLFKLTPEWLQERIAFFQEKSKQYE